MTTNYAELDRETPTTHPWGTGLFIPILASFAFTVVIFLLTAIREAGDFEGEFANVVFGEITTSLTILSAVLSSLVLVVYVFAYIRRPDPASSRFAGIWGRGEWLIVATFVVAALTSTIAAS
jgi:hypothetical protein